MKKITLLIIFAFLSFFQGNAQVVIGSGNLETSSIPLEPYYGYSYTQSVYLASEINATGTIIGLQWYYSGTTDLGNSQELVIYLAESTRTDYADTDDWEPIASFTEVYSGGITVTAGAQGWTQIVFDTPFVYAGTGNLIIAVEENMADYDGFSDDFYTSVVTGNRSIYYFNDGTNPDPASPPTASGITDRISNVTLDGVTQSCPNPANLAANTITDTSAELSWTQAGSPSLWNIEIVESGTTPTGVPTHIGVTNPFTVNNLTAVTGYDFYVQADCDSEVSGWSGPFTFTTQCGVFTPDYLQNFATIPADCWEEADSGDETTGPMDLGAGSWLADGYLNNGTTGAFKINLYVASKSDWIISPQFDLTGGPFQVEFDFGVLSWNTTNPGTLGSDDKVEFFITTDSGATWTSLLLWDNASVFSSSGEHPVVDLTAYSGETVQFAVLGSEGTVNDPEDIDVFVDNFQVRNIPTCQEPTDLNATNLSLTSTEISWTENGTSALWNIEYGEEDFVQGDGTIVNDVTSNPYTLTGLTENTSYQFYVQTNCGTDGLSSWTGPFTFLTGYCESVPSSNDGEGVTNVTLVNTDFPSLGDLTYEDHTATSVNVFQGIDTNLEITFATGFTYNTNVWIDFNDDLVFDEDELVYQGESSNDNPTTLDATFTMPATATLGEHRMRIGTADFGQTTPNPCYNGSWGVTLDFTVNIEELDCTLPEAEYSMVTDCDNDQIFVDVIITSLGDAAVLNITNTYNSDLQPVTETGTYQVGPVPFNEEIKVFVASVQNSDCTITSPTYSLGACPPENDAPCDATVAGVNEGETCDIITPGTLLEATDSGVPYLNCNGDPNDDVWFEFTALGEQQIIQITNIQNGFGIDHAVYSGTCDNLVELYCSDNDNSLTPTLTIGDTYFIRVFSGSANPQTITFDLCIQTLGNPTYCLDALPICPGLPDPFPSVSDGSSAPTYLDYDCLGSQPNPYWNTINVDLAGDYNFTLEQTSDAGQLIDIDFIVWGPFTSQEDGCYQLLPENIEDCSYSATATETVEIFGAPANSIYVILITNFNGGSGTYTFEQESGPEDGINCDVVCVPTLEYDGVEIEQGDTAPEGESDPIVLCGVDSLTLTANTVYNVDTYDWFLDGIYIDGQTTNTLEVTESGQYFVTVGGSLCADYVDSLVANVIIYDSAEANQAPDLVACDDESGDGVEEFNLESQTPTILGTQNASDFAVTYYATLADAETGSNALASPYSAADGTIIYVRVEDVDAVGSDSGCAITDTTFNLVISGAIPTAEENQDMNLCDANNPGDEVEEFDLESNAINILGTQDPVNYTVTYYLTLADAEAGMSALLSPFTNTTNPQTIYARVESNASTSCYATTSFDLIVLEVPVLGTAPDVEGCDSNNDGTGTFNLTDAESDILGGATGMTVSYYTTQADADASLNAITGTTAYESILTTIYVRVETSEGCYETTSFALVFADKPVLGTAPDVESCDSNNDGTGTFNLTDAESDILGGATGMTVSYYTTQSDSDASLNAITTTTAYESMLTTIYVRVETTEGCYETTSFELVFSDKPVLGTASDLLGCDSDNDGSSLFNLTFVESEVLGGLTDMTVSYYASQSDADNSINELVDTTEYESVPTTIYVRVENSEGCYETTSFELALGGNSPIVSIDTSTPYEFCPTSSTPVTIIANADNFTLSDEVTISWWHDGEELEGENGLELSNVLEVGTYTIQATSNFSSECMSEDTVEVVEVACIIPQGISPNNDNKNDSFDLSDFDVQSLEIYNRYGRLVYSKTDYTNEWSGQSKDGDELPVGTYYYVMKYQGNKVKAAWVYINREQ